MTSKTYSSNLHNNYMQNSRSPLYSSTNDNMNNISPANNLPPYQGPYIFKERSGRLKWREIMKLDVDLMIRENDISPLENYLENLIFSNVDETDLQIVPETSFLKLVKINQYVMEFLLDTQQRLEYENKILEVNYSQVVNDAITKENILKENKSLINALKKDKKEKEIVLNTYKCLIDEYKSQGIIGVNNNNNNYQSSSNSIVERKYFFCKFCEGKRFSSEENLEAHLRRRHGREFNSGESSKEFNKNSSLTSTPKIEEKFEEMKSFFETYVKNFHNDSYLKLIEQQKNLEHKLSEIKSEKGNDFREIENTFKSTLLEMKEMYLKNSMINNQSMSQSQLLGLANTGFVNPLNPVNNVNSSRMNTEKSIRKDSDDEKKLHDVSNEKSAEKAAKKIKKETKKMNETLKEVSKEQNEKIEKLMDQFMKFKETIVDEFKEIKEKSIQVSENNFNKKDEQQATKISKVESIQISKEEETLNKMSPSRRVKSSINKQIELVKENVVEKTIPKKKVLFNAGPLESDNEEDKDNNNIDKEEMKFKNSSVNIEALNKADNIDPKFSFAPKEKENGINKPILVENPFNIGDKPEKTFNNKEEESVAMPIIRESKVDNNTSEANKADINTIPSEENEEKLPMEKALSINKLNKEEKLDEVDKVNQEVVKEVKLEEVPVSPINKPEKVIEEKNDKDKLVAPVEKLDIEKVKKEELLKQEEQNKKIKEEEKIKSKEDLEKFYHSFVTRDNKAIEKPKIEICVEKIM
jgi:hypothetical protein